MTQYVQYNEEGFITATVITTADAPDHPRQLVFESPVDTTGKMVDVENEILIDSIEP